MALSNAGRPPSVGSFSRSAITTRLWAAFESADRHSHWTVQPSGTITCRRAPDCPLMSAAGEPDGRVVSSRRDTVLVALSEESHETGVGLALRTLGVRNRDHGSEADKRESGPRSESAKSWDHG